MRSQRSQRTRPKQFDFAKMEKVTFEEGPVKILLAVDLIRNLFAAPFHAGDVDKRWRQSRSDRSNRSPMRDRFQEAKGDQLSVRDYRQ